MRRPVPSPVRRADIDEAGFTLVEVLITVAVMSIIMLASLAFLDRTTRLTRMAASSTNSDQDGQVGLRTMSQDIRSAFPIGATCGSGYKNCLTFSVPRPSDGHLSCVSVITFRVTSATVLQDRTDTGCAPSVARSYAARKIMTLVPGTTDIFTYYDRLNRPIDPTVSCGGSLACVLDARAVRITLPVQYREQTTGNSILSNTVALRNNRQDTP